MFWARVSRLCRLSELGSCRSAMTLSYRNSERHHCTRPLVVHKSRDDKKNKSSSIPSFFHIQYSRDELFTQHKQTNGVRFVIPRGRSTENDTLSLNKPPQEKSTQSPKIYMFHLESYGRTPHDNRGPKTLLSQRQPMATMKRTYTRPAVLDERQKHQKLSESSMMFT